MIRILLLNVFVFFFFAISNAQVANDTPCVGGAFPPIELVKDSTHIGTTCGSIGYNEDATDEYANQTCPGMFDDDAVWYFIDHLHHGQGIQIMVNSMGISDDYLVEVYTSYAVDGACANLQLDYYTGKCVSQNVLLNLGECETNMYYFVKVATNESSCGSFSISASYNNCASNSCEDAELLYADTPEACSEPEIVNSKQSCLGNACPDINVMSCGIDTLPTVWFKIQPNSPDATQLVTLVEAEGFIPIWSVYRGDDCSDLTLVSDISVFNGLTIYDECSISDDDPTDHHVTTIRDNPDTNEPYSYYVAVSGMPLPGHNAISNSDFTLYYFASLGCLACSGENAYDCDNGEFTATVDGLPYDPDGDGIAGPFCPGQEVEVCWEFLFDTTGSGFDWLHGMIPTLGSGWDVVNSDIASQDIGGEWQWYTENDTCAPTVNAVQLPNLCTYVEDGVLKLCNVVCNPACPCEGEQPLEVGSQLPSAWFWNSPACGGSKCPNEEFGIISGSSVEVDACLTLKVKENAIGQNSDLQIHIQPTSDAITGCWFNQSPCILDPSISSPEWRVINVADFSLEYTDTNICNGEALAVEITNNLQAAMNIDIEPIANSFITGANSQSLETVSAAMLSDELVNTSSQTQLIEYQLTAFLSDLNCTPVIDTLRVYVLPQINIDIPNQSICAGNAIDINAIDFTSGGSGAYVSFVWTPTLSNSPSVQISDPSIAEYCVTVTDDMDCSGSHCFSVEFSNEAFIQLEENSSVCNMSGGSGATSINLDDQIIQATMGQWSNINDWDFDIANNVVDFEGVPLGNYYFEYMTTSTSDPCINIADTLLVQVVDCDCPPISLQTNNSICISEVNNFDLNALIINASPGTWSLSDANPMALSLSGSVLDLSNAVSGIYTLNYTLDNPVDNCPASSSVELELNNGLEATLQEEAIACAVDMNGGHLLNFNELIISGDTNGNWTDIDGSGVDLSDLEAVSFLGLEFGTQYRFRYSLDNDEPCPDFQYELVVHVVDCSCPIIEVPDLDVICASVESVDIGQQWTSDELNINNGILDLEGVESGIYNMLYTVPDSLQVEDCPTTATSTVEVLDIGLEFVANSINCYQGSDGRIELLFNGGAGDYSFEWSHGDTTNLLLGLSAGTYEVSVTELASGCQEMVSITLEDPTELMADIEYVQDSLVLYVTGGVAPYTYLWNTGETTASIMPEQMDSVYTVTVSDMLGCDTIASFVFVNTIEEFENVSIYPNPFSKQIVVSGYSGVVSEISVYNILGQEVEVSSQEDNGRLILQFDESEFAVYYLRLDIGGKILLRKIIQVE